MKTIQSFTKRIWALVVRHKLISAAVLIVAVVVVYYLINSAKTTSETRTVFAAVERGDIVSTLNGTGQVSSSNQVEIKSKASGDIVYLNAKTGQEVKAGDLLMQIDAGNAGYELETARLSYEDFVTVDADELRDAQNSFDSAKDALDESYLTARASLTTASTEMADILIEVKDLLEGYLNPAKGYGSGKTFKEHTDRVESSYYTADKLLKEFVKEYRTVSASTQDAKVEGLVSDAHAASLVVAQAVKYAQDAVVYVRDGGADKSGQTAGNTAYDSVTGLVTSVNKIVSDLSSAKSSIGSKERAFETAQIDLDELKNGPDALDLRSEQLALRQKQDAYADYFIRAPFDGVVASVDVKKGEDVSNGTTAVTLITKQKTAEISLNEIDVAKVSVGQKANLTFDAFEGMTVVGEVAEVDILGTVSQGVVSYTVKIVFEDDGKVKPGMTVSADIITDTKEGVLTVLSSAVKSQGNRSYVELENGDRAPVVTGLSNDTLIEVVSGLAEGDRYVARTITTTAGAAATSQSSRGIFGGSTQRPVTR